MSLYNKVFSKKDNYDHITLSKESSVSKNIKQVIVVRRDLNMRKGKIASQVAHASQAWLFANNESNRVDELKIKLTSSEAMWLTGSHAKVVTYVDSEDELRDLMFHAEIKGVQFHPIIDEGRTEFHGQSTLTCCAFGPDDEESINEITGKLKLL